MQPIERNKQGFVVLKRKYSTLYKKVNYIAPVSYCINNIYEYDIRMANVSVLRAAKALPEKLLDRIADMTKEERVVFIGKMIRENKDIQKVISKGIIEAKRKLFQANNIIDSEILSVKNDAVFVIGRKLKTTKFGPIEFVVKNKFSIYYNINGLEFYYDKRNDKVTVKGMSDEIIETKDHKKGMIVFLTTVFNHLIYDRKKELHDYLLYFVDAYKNRELPVWYYREMNPENVYRFKEEIDGYTFNLENVSESNIDELNIIYNYRFYVMPMVQQYV